MTEGRWRSHGPVWLALRRAARPLTLPDIERAARLSRGEVEVHLAHLRGIGVVARHETDTTPRYRYALTEGETADA